MQQSAWLSKEHPTASGRERWDGMGIARGRERWDGMGIARGREEEDDGMKIEWGGEICAEE